MNWIIGGAFGWLAGRSVRQGRQIRALQGPQPPTRRERRRAAYRARRDAYKLAHTRRKVQA